MSKGVEYSSPERKAGGSFAAGAVFRGSLFYKPETAIQHQAQTDKV